MSVMIDKVVQKVTVDYCRLSIVGNRDGFLANAAVRTLIYQQRGIEVVTGTNLELRVHYELTYKNGDERFIYVCESTESVLPDMREEAYVTEFSVSDVFPLFADKSLLRKQSYEVLERLYEQYGMRRLSMTEAAIVMETVAREIEERKRQSAEFIKEQIRETVVDWSKMDDTITAVTKILVKAIKAGVYGEIATAVAEINEKFQRWVDENYLATLQSNPLFKARSVNKILPHLSNKYGKDDKVALMVVDGFSYWQYVILKESLQRGKMTVEDGVTLSWLPSITMLSRQAIFRGGEPKQDYRQNPENEKSLWFEYWKRQGFGHYEIQYIYDTDEFAINEGVKRLAVVTVEMDEKMHSSTDYKDLLSLTENWAQRTMPKIEAIVNAGYTLYITTDHGSVLSRGWRSITAAERVFLYKDGSRGKRHLIYENKEEGESFYDANKDLSIIKHDNWLAIRDSRCFAKESSVMITHGGSHFMEMVIPLIKIRR